MLHVCLCMYLALRQLFISDSWIYTYVWIVNIGFYYILIRFILTCEIMQHCVHVSKFAFSQLNLLNAYYNVCHSVNLTWHLITKTNDGHFECSCWVVYYLIIHDVMCGSVTSSGQYRGFMKTYEKLSGGVDRWIKLFLICGIHQLQN